MGTQRERSFPACRTNAAVLRGKPLLNRTPFEICAMWRGATGRGAMDRARPTASMLRRLRGRNELRPYGNGP
jgi:hypothetical protein